MDLGGPLLVLAAQPQADEPHSEPTALFLSLLLSRHPRVVRCYIESSHQALPQGDARILVTQPQLHSCTLCYRRYAALPPAGTCELCGGAVLSRAASLSGDVDSALLAGARADHATVVAGGGSVLVLGVPHGASLRAILACSAGAKRVAVGVAGIHEDLTPPGFPSPSDLAISGALAEGLEAVTEALGWREAFSQALAALRQQAQQGQEAREEEPPSLQGGANGQGQEQEEVGEQRVVQSAIKAALAAASSCNPKSLTALDQLARAAAGGAAAASGEETEDDGKFFLSIGEEGGEGGEPQQPPPMAFLYTGFSDDEGDEEEEEEEGEEGEEVVVEGKTE